MFNEKRLKKKKKSSSDEDEEFGEVPLSKSVSAVYHLLYSQSKREL